MKKDLSHAITSMLWSRLREYTAPRQFSRTTRISNSCGRSSCAKIGESCKPLALSGPTPLMHPIRIIVPSYPGYRESRLRSRCRRNTPCGGRCGGLTQCEELAMLLLFPAKSKKISCKLNLRGWFGIQRGFNVCPSFYPAGSRARLLAVGQARLMAAVTRVKPSPRRLTHVLFSKK